MTNCNARNMQSLLVEEEQIGVISRLIDFKSSSKPIRVERLIRGFNTNYFLVTMGVANDFHAYNPYLFTIEKALQTVLPTSFTTNLYYYRKTHYEENYIT